MTLPSCQGPNLCARQTELPRDLIGVCFVSDFNILQKYILIKSVNCNGERHFNFKSKFKHFIDWVVTPKYVVSKV